ncbi:MULTISPECIES: type II toxin-antitoxin system ParD family antitoxin [Nostoc]|jgi:antitoxin ParD1/3/4|uniref:Type II toxin-antitoxin system ParD family antitoxin n=2 Tax=Nostoc TaxID=1177 RepID=A0ABR8IEW3_9NOSO|nr:MULTISPECIES: type II toxin-antitoxin system ParD family antitoxin [Nostoc]MBD2565590.1 type II toxin-antitoxin system ParD family antitoxin [Nostoc linckia FACHB-391]MBD2649972.1 type II toxin-antitoxin system ParD family antitoxin [Nostoc foliaceum FACHB-393]QLE45802.1 type II toxin-antitoxin system ParD family antitoxin [Nostoc sp. C052]QLE53870.1 type II toxin-antitoxin system ParD family antitoxin [Nostoc sp. C057]
MNVSLTIELEKWVQSKVESGMYTSASEVIREGLRLLKDQDALKAIRLAELRREIQQGIDSGESTPLNMDEIIELAKQQRQTRESP